MLVKMLIQTIGTILFEVQKSEWPGGYSKPVTGLSITNCIGGTLYRRYEVTGSKEH